MKRESVPAGSIGARLFEKVCVGLALSALLLPVPASARDYPTRTVRIIVPFPPGGPIDYVARQVATGLSQRLEQPFVVQNRTGAAGTIGIDEAGAAPPDGYTLLVAPDFTLQKHQFQQGIGQGGFRNVTPVTILVSERVCLVAHPSLPVNTVAQLVDYSRRNRGALNLASLGENGEMNLYARYLVKTAKMGDVNVVPYNGAAQAMMDVLGGGVQLGFLPCSQVSQAHRDGTVKALATTGNRRAQEFKGTVPTFAEAGFPGMDLAKLTNLFAPVKLEPSIRKRLYEEVRALLRDEGTQSLLAERGLYVEASTPEQSVERLAASERRISQVREDLGLKW